MLSNYLIGGRETSEFSRHWKIILGCAIGMFLGPAGIAYYSFGVFVIPLEKEFGWSLSNITSWMTWMGIGSLAMAPVAGMLADKIGVKLLLIGSIPIFSCLFFLLSLIDGNVSIYYGAAFMAGSIGTFMGTMNYTRVINGWFEHGRGRALAIITAGVSVSAIVGPWMTQEIVIAYGWRCGFLFLGFMAIVAWPIVWGLLSDSEGPSNVVIKAQSGVVSAMLRPIFWMILFAVMLCSLSAGIIIHVISYLVKLGFPRSYAAMLFGVIGISSIVGRFLSGVLIDKVRAILLVPILLSFQAFAFGALPFLPSKLVFFSLSVIGFGFGIEGDYLPYLIYTSFGLRSYAGLYGTITSMAGAISMFGPVIYAIIEETTGNYSVSFIVAGVFAFVASVMLALSAWSVRTSR